jgi:hypothetical protein
MAEAMLPNATTVETKRNSGGSTTKGKMWACTAKLYEEKWKYARLAQENGLAQHCVGLQVAVSGNKWHKGPQMAGEW